VAVAACPTVARGCGRAFRSIGMDTRVTPDEDARTLELGAKYNSGDECYPQRIVLGDYMKLFEDQHLDPRRPLSSFHREWAMPLRPVRQAAAPYPRRAGYEMWPSSRSRRPTATRA